MPMFQTANNGNAFPTTSNATQSIVTAVTTSTVLLAANTTRRGATIFNDSMATLYVNFAATANATDSYVVPLESKAYYEIPFAWTGVISGIWSAANGNAQIYELT
jgi:archaellum component FlaF (FlaF/FlaG flagellin family)